MTNEKLYFVLQVTYAIVLVVCAILLFIMRKASSRRMILMAMASILHFITLIEIPVQIQLGKPYGVSIVVVIAWFFCAMLVMYKLGTNKE